MSLFPLSLCPHFKELFTDIQLIEFSWNELSVEAKLQTLESWHFSAPRI